MTINQSSENHEPLSQSSNRTKLKPEEIGPWSEVKLEIVQKYAAAYSRILTNQRWAHAVYIDAFSGMGIHKSRSDGTLVTGSPIRALDVSPKFGHYYFIDLEETKTKVLSDLCKERDDVSVLTGDCNKLMHSTIIPELKRHRNWRALCLLDPYGIHYHWSMVEALGKTGQVDLFLHFSVFDINRNAVRDNPDKLTRAQVERMNSYWGDESWQALLYDDVPDLFDANHRHRMGRVVDLLVPAYKRRLSEVAGFKELVNPLPFKNNRGALLYYMYFASPVPVATRIVRDIFDKHDPGSIMEGS